MQKTHNKASHSDPASNGLEKQAIKRLPAACLRRYILRIGMKVNLIISAIIVFLYSHSTYAAPSVGGNVERLYVKHDGLVLFKVGTPPTECNDNNWPFTFSLQDLPAKEWVSMLLAARTAKQEIRVGYSANGAARCNVVYIYHN